MSEREQLTPTEEAFERLRKRLTWLVEDSGSLTPAELSDIQAVRDALNPALSTGVPAGSPEPVAWLDPGEARRLVAELCEAARFLRGCVNAMVPPSVSDLTMFAKVCAEAAAALDVPAGETVASEERLDWLLNLLRRAHNVRASEAAGAVIHWTEEGQGWHVTGATLRDAIDNGRSAEQNRSTDSAESEGRYENPLGSCPPQPAAGNDSLYTPHEWQIVCALRMEQDAHEITKRERNELRRQAAPVRQQDAPSDVRERDSERLDWLEESGVLDIEAVPGRTPVDLWRLEIVTPCDPNVDQTLREAIDAARSLPQEGNQE